MKYLLAFIIFLPTVVFSQKYTIIETGRPKAPLLWNAQELAGKKFKIKYKYVAFNNTESQIDSINKINDKSFQRLEKRYGKDWEKQLQNAIDKEKLILDVFVNQLEYEEHLNDERTVYFTKKTCGKVKYRANIYPNIAPEERSKKTLLKSIVFTSVLKR